MKVKLTEEQYNRLLTENTGDEWVELKLLMLIVGYLIKLEIKSKTVG